MYSIEHIKTSATRTQQIAKIEEENWEFFQDFSPEESCDCIRAHMTYLENHCGGFKVNWKIHEKKMRRRKYKTREAYDNGRVENSGKPKGRKGQG